LEEIKMEKQKSMKNMFAKCKKYIPNKDDGIKFIKATVYFLFINLLLEFAIWQFSQKSHADLPQATEIHMTTGPVLVSETDILKNTIAEILKAQGSEREKIKKITALVSK
jgi:hypothetical protein